MPPSALIKKLGLKSSQSVLVLKAPPGLVEALGDLPEGVQLSDRADNPFDFVLVFVMDSTEFGDLTGTARRAVRYDGILWICYPKKSSKVPSDLSRDVVWKLMMGTGLRPVTQISIDEVWSALRFCPEERVGK